MSWQGSNVDLERVRTIEEEIILSTHEQEQLLAEYDLLTRHGEPASVAQLLEAYFGALEACPATGANPTETKRAREIACRKEAAALRHAEERIAYLRKALDVLATKVSGLQTRGNMLRTQMGMDGRAR